MAIKRTDSGGSGGSGSSSDDEEMLSDEEVVRQAKQEQRQSTESTEAEQDAADAQTTADADGLTLEDIGLGGTSSSDSGSGGSGGSGGSTSTVDGGSGGSGGGGNRSETPTQDDLDPRDFGADPGQNDVRQTGGGTEITDAQQQNIDAAVAEVNERVQRKQQGVEQRGGRVGEQARKLEQQALDQNPDLTAEDIRVRRDGNRIRTELTPTGAERVGANPTRAEVAKLVAGRNDTVEADDLRVTSRTGGGFDVGLTAEAFFDRRLPNDVDVSADVDKTLRANQSQSFSTRTFGTTGTLEAPDGDLFSTDVLGTTGTRQSRLRNRTVRANQSESLSTRTLGTRDEVGFDVGDLDRETQQRVNKAAVGSLAARTTVRQQEVESQEEGFLNDISGGLPDQAQAVEEDLLGGTRESFSRGVEDAKDAPGELFGQSGGRAVGGGLAGAAAAGVVAPEPVTSVGGAAVLGGLAVAGAAGAVASQNGGLLPRRRNSGEIPVEEGRPQSEISVVENTDRVEIPIPSEVVRDRGEITVPDQMDRSEISIDDGGMNVPSDFDGRIVIRAAQKQKEKQKEKEEEEEEEEEDEEEEDEFSDVIVEVPSELIPDEEVVIGGEESGNADADPAEQEEEIEEESDVQGVDDAVPEDTSTDKEFDGAETDLTRIVEPVEDTSQSGEAFGVGQSGPPRPEVDVPGLDEEQEIQSEVDVGVDPQPGQRIGTEEELDIDIDTDVTTDAGTAQGIRPGEALDVGAPQAERAAVDTALIDAVDVAQTQDALQVSQPALANSPALSNPTVTPTNAVGNSFPNEFVFEEVTPESPAEGTGRGGRGKRKRRPDFDLTSGDVEADVDSLFDSSLQRNPVRDPNEVADDLFGGDLFDD